MENANRGTWAAWVRDLAFIVAIAGGAWAIADAIGDVKVEVEQLRGKVEHNTLLIERNAEAIERNAKAIERNAEAIGELKESIARLEGRYTEHIRWHKELAGS